MLLGDNARIGRKIWDGSVQRKYPLDGTERYPLAQDEAGDGGKYYVDTDGIADYINSSSSSSTGLIPVTITSNSTTTYAGDPTPVQSAVSQSILYYFKIPTGNTNTGASTLNITFTTPLGAKSIKKIVGGAKTALSSGDLTAGITYNCYYDGTDYVLNSGKISTLYDNDGNLLIIGIDNVLNFPTTQSSMTLYVDPNGVDINALKKNHLSPYKSINGTNGANANAPWLNTVYINSGIFETGDNIFAKNGVYYMLNNGTFLNFTRNPSGASSSSQLIADDTSSAVTSTIKGAGSIIQSGGQFINLNNSSSVFELCAENIQNGRGGYSTSGYITITNNAISKINLKSLDATGVIVSNGANLSLNVDGDVTCNANQPNFIQITGESGNSNYIKIGGKISSGGITIVANTGSYTYIDIDRAYQISPNDNTMIIISGTGGTVVIKGKYRYTSPSPTAANNPIVKITSGSPNVIFIDTVLIGVYNTSVINTTVSVINNGTQPIRYMGTNILACSPTGTTTTIIGQTPTIDATIINLI